MLIQFHVKNYKSFRDDTRLDLSATKVTEYPHHVVEMGNEKILKTAAIYGANASGKTKLYDAFRYMSYYVQNSFGFGGMNETENENRYIKPQPFMMDGTSQNADSLFEVYFTTNNDDKVYNYGFTVNKEKVTEEWLNYKSRTGRNYNTIFYRETGAELHMSGIPKKYAENITISLNDETLILSLGAKLKINKLETVYNWFDTLIFLSFGNPETNYYLSKQMPRDMNTKQIIRDNIAKYIRTFDPCITGFTIKEVKRDSENIPKAYNISTVHRTQNTSKTVQIRLAEEAAGTQKMFSLYEPLQRTIANGGVLFVDELNDRLHPLLARNFIQTFLDPKRNPNNAQLIFTTHDTWQLSADLLRRDEIWFTEKKPDEASVLYSLVDFKGEDNARVRKDADYEKNYLLGKYGATPVLKQININGDES